MQRLRTLALLCVVCATAAASGELGAATPLRPAVSITRNLQLNGAVWPGDFNGDGKPDLIASDTAVGGNPDVLLVVLGTGTGSFGAPIKSTFAGQVLGVGDFNGDRKLDVIATDKQRTKVYIVAGNGNGTLGAAHLVSDFGTTVTFAVSADLDGDGKRDLVVGVDGTTVRVLPGHGDFSFAAPITLTTNPAPSDAIVADFNGDGRPDLAITNRFFAYSVGVFLNQGGFMFAARDIALGRSATDVAAADVNGDGHVDLLVSTAAPEDVGFFTEGYVNVLLGNGNGTFQGPAVYTVPPGPWQIVVGDFTRDGMLDIATANRSPILSDDCANAFKTWDTVSILPGRGDGTFGAPSTFSLGDQSDLGDGRYRESVLSLNTSDLNGDHQTDLIASWGAILTNVAATTNRPPTVTVGRNASFNGSVTDLVLQAVASDPDDDMLTYSWTASDGRSLPPVPTPCVSIFGPGNHTFTVTVTDAHGGTASSSVTFTVKPQVFPTVTVTAPKPGEVVAAGKPYTIAWTASSDTPITRIDVSVTTIVGNNGTSQTICESLPGSATSCTWNSPGPATDNAKIVVHAIDADFDDGFGLSGQFSIHSESFGSLPTGWQQRDIGAVAAAGTAGSVNGVFTVKGSGADIWNDADEFHYVYRTLNGASSGPTDLTTRVDRVDNVNVWTKAGLMVRATLDANSPHASIFITPGRGVSFQRRTTIGGTSSQTTTVDVVAPVWLRLAVDSGEVRAFYKKNVTDAWIQLGVQTFSSRVDGYAGLAVTSHVDRSLAGAAFSNVSVASTPPALATSTLIGGATGTSSADAARRAYTLTDRGADIWGTADQFTFAYANTSGDAEISTLVRSETNTNAWTKAGVMFRNSTAAGSAHVSVFVTPGKGVAMQYRGSTGASSVQAAQALGPTAPLFVRLIRHGNTFTGQWSSDASNWQTLSIITIPLSTSSLVGVALSSHDSSATATATFVDPAIR